MANLSQKKRERMLAFLQQLKEEHKDDDSVLIALGEIESELTAKKYGLVWEQHEEAVDEDLYEEEDDDPGEGEGVGKDMTGEEGAEDY